MLFLTSQKFPCMQNDCREIRANDKLNGLLKLNQFKCKNQNFIKYKQYDIHIFIILITFAF